MRALLAGLGRVLGVQLALGLGDGLSERASRRLLVLPWSPVRSPWLTVVVLGGLGFLALGWSMRGEVRDRVPVGIGGFVQAHARMMFAYAALLVPNLAAGRARDSTDDPLPTISVPRGRRGGARVVGRARPRADSRRRHATARRAGVPPRPPLVFRLTRT